MKIITRDELLKNNKPLIIGGPCAVESRAQIRTIAKQLSAMGVKILRCQLWKPRTDKDSFQGVGLKGLKWLKEIKKELGVKIATEIVKEKIFDALVKRKKPRDFYDLYIIMRKGMLSLEQKKKLAEIKDSVIADAKQINFKTELGTFLPVDQQGIIRDFSATLERELNSQLSGV